MLPGGLDDVSEPANDEDGGATVELALAALEPPISAMSSGGTREFPRSLTTGFASVLRSGATLTACLSHGLWHELDTARVGSHRSGSGPAGAAPSGRPGIASVGER